MQAIKALELCLEYNIKIDEDMAEKLSGENVQALKDDPGITFIANLEKNRKFQRFEITSL